MPKDEHDLVARAKRHDSTAFGELYARHSARIFKYLYFKTTHPQEAEDLTARVFLKAWESITSFEWQGYPFSTWLYRIAHNQLVDYYRTRHTAVPFDLAREQPFPTDPFEQVESAMLLTQVHSALRELTKEQQQVVQLRYFDGYSTNEIAEIMNKAPDAVRAMQHRALRALQPRIRAQASAES